MTCSDSHFIFREPRWAIRLGHAKHSWYAGIPNPLVFKTRKEARSFVKHIAGRGAQVWKVVRVEVFVRDL